VPSTLRSAGTIDLGFVAAEGRSVARRTFQSGNMRLRIPRDAARDDAPCAVIINTAGGLAEGDRVDLRVAWDEGARAIVASQAAEKVYRGLDRGATVSTTVDVGPDANAEWLPQETILFDRARLQRDLRIHLAPGATFLGLEAVVFGRTAMGETMQSGRLRDRIRIWRDGRLIYADCAVLDGPVHELLGRAAIGCGANATAMILLAAEQASERLAPLRDVLAGASGQAAASALDGLLVVRLLAPDGVTLRNDLTAALAVLRDGRPLPRVWRC
jgi:urease accessory protein